MIRVRTSVPNARGVDHAATAHEAGVAGDHERNRHPPATSASGKRDDLTVVQSSPVTVTTIRWARGLPSHRGMRTVFVAVGFLIVVGLGPHDLSAQTVAGPRGPAWDALRAGNHEEAERVFQAGLRLHPADPLLQFGLGVALQAQQRSDEARAPLTRALELEPRFTAAADLLGRILYASGDLDGAIALYERATA